MSEKRELERWAVMEFAKLFSSRAGRGELRLEELLDPPSPDTRCVLGDTEVFIEVAHVYGTETDAKMVLGRDGKSAPNPTVHSAQALIHLGLRVIAPLNAILAKKALKEYDKSPVWLLVRSASPFMEHEDFSSWFRNQIVVPESHPYDEIWLLCGRSANDGAVRLA